MLLEQLKVELKVYLRQPLYLLFSLAMPIMSFLIFGFMYGSASYDGVDYFSQYIPSFCVLILFASSVYNIGNQVVSDKEKDIYKRISVTPVKLSRIMFVVVLKAFLLAFTGFLLIIVLALLFFDVTLKSFPVFVIAYIIAAVYALIFGFGLGAICDKITTYSSIMMLIFTPMYFLSDAAIPLSVLPPVFGYIAKVLPLYHLNVIMRTMWDISTFQANSKQFCISLIYLVVFLTVFLFFVGKSWGKKKV